MSKPRWLACFLLVLISSAVRFVHLDSDFPRGLTTSRALYTDEGLYFANAVSLSEGPRWYIPGELNPIINLPIAPILAADVFRRFGRSLVSARSLIAVMSLVLIAAAFALTMRYGPLWCAGLVAATLSVDFFLFSSARFATLDVIATAIVVVAFVGESWIPTKRAALAAAVAGTLIGVAALTKTTALCALPALAYLCGARVADLRRRRWVAMSALGTCGLLWVGYNALAWRAYPVDYIYFHRVAEVRLASGPLDLVRNFAVAVFSTVRADPLLTLLAFGLAAALFRVSAAFRASVLVRTSAIWVLAFLAMLSITSYQPSRYFVLVLVPIVILFGLAIVHLGDLFPHGRSAAAARLGAVGCVLVCGAVQIADYVTHPTYSFARMVREVGDLVNGASTSQRSGVLIGTMAASVSLERSLTAISPEYGTQDLETRIARHCPTHFITLQAPGEDEHRALSSSYVIEPIGEWKVFENYYEHRPVRLFRLHPRDGYLPACPR